MDLQNVNWSRNLSANNKTELNRMRLITIQKMENVRNRNQKSIVTSTRQKSAIFKNENLKKNDENKTDFYLEKIENNENGKNEQKEKFIQNENLSQKEKFDKIENPNKLEKQNKIEKQNKLENLNKLEKHHYTEISNENEDDFCISQTQSAEEDNSNEISDDDSFKTDFIKKKIEKSKSAFELNKNNIVNEENEISIESSKTEINPLKKLLNNVELLNFVINPVPKGKIYQCTIIRDKKGLDRSLYPTYYMHLESINDKDSFKPKDSNLENNKNGNKYKSSNMLNKLSDNDDNQINNRQVFLLSGRRRKKSKTYLISCNPFEITRANSIAKLKSNVIGTHFNTIRILQNNDRLDYVSTIYETNVLGFKGPRKMTVFIPKINSADYYKQINKDKEITLTELYKIDPNSIIKLKNKTPVWNEDTQSYVLNFKGRVTQASVKNFQLEQCDLIEEKKLENLNENENTSDLDETKDSSKSINKLGSNDSISMQFGKISNKEFTCDVSWPLCILQAFSIALSSFDSKLACE